MRRRSASCGMARHPGTWRAACKASSSQVARHLAGSSYSAIYCSDLLRAVQTAACIAAATDLPVFQEAQLRERHLGCCQGLTFEEIARTAPAAMDQLRSPSPDVQIDGGGESRAELQARAQRVLIQLAARHRGERILCITHGGFLHCCYSVATGTTYPGKNLNGALNTVLVEGSSCALVEWGQMGHLQDVHLDARGFGGGASDG
mmetsp:Transcript_5941/g.17003  ORF Transcript_5941/g.17003 Transcript_5941/m.17003 type:complete len:204 (-) Transcript_5941:359-970(-)